MKKPLKLASIMLIAVVISTIALAIMMSNGAWGKFFTHDDTTDGAQVAAFNVTETGVQDKTFTLDNMAPGTTINHTFTITNQGEVAVKCVVNINATTNMPLIFKVNGVTITPGTPVEVDTLAPQQGTKSYTLTITWPAELTSAEYSGLIDAVQLMVVTEQID